MKEVEVGDFILFVFKRETFTGKNKESHQDLPLIGLCVYKSPIGKNGIFFIEFKIIEAADSVKKFICLPPDENYRAIFEKWGQTCKPADSHIKETLIDIQSDKDELIGNNLGYFL